MAEEKTGEKMVPFKNGVSWAGSNFSHAPGDVVELPEATAQARQEAGLGTIVKGK